MLSDRNLANAIRRTGFIALLAYFCFLLFSDSSITPTQFVITYWRSYMAAIVLCFVASKL